MQDCSVKVTYLFGAGASCGTLPLASNLGEDIGLLAEEMKNNLVSFYNTTTDSYGNPKCPEERLPPPRGTYGKTLFESLDWLCDTAKNHNSIDTIARKLWMRSNSDSLGELTRLKAALAAYLWYKQITRPSDKRYDTFFATILQKEGSQPPTLPSPIRILTWNYDLLLERSFYEFCLDYTYTRETVFDKQGVTHLNGYSSVESSARIRLQNDAGNFEYALFDGIDDRFEMVIELFERCTKTHPTERLKTKIAFAWENNRIISEAASIASGTTILVIVGYSFPFFNREADKTILKAMSPSLDTIYLQVNSSIGPRERLLTILNELDPKTNWMEKISEIEESDYIVIPNELIQ